MKINIHINLYENLPIYGWIYVIFWEISVYFVLFRSRRCVWSRWEGFNMKFPMSKNKIN